MCMIHVEISALNVNSVDPDQTPRFAASDLGLHCQCPLHEILGINGLITVPVKIWQNRKIM